MGPIWDRQDPGGSHVGPMNFAIGKGKSTSDYFILLWSHLTCYPLQGFDPTIHGNIMLKSLNKWQCDYQVLTLYIAIPLTQPANWTDALLKTYLINSIGNQRHVITWWHQYTHTESCWQIFSFQIENFIFLCVCEMIVLWLDKPLSSGTFSLSKTYKFALWSNICFY